MPQQNYQNLVRKRIFADPASEEYECTAGTAQLLRFLQNRKLNKCFAVLSSLSLYCKGNCYIQKASAPMKKRMVEYRVDLSDIQEVRHIRKNPTWLLSVCLFFLILAPVLLILELVLKVGQRTSFNPILDVTVCVLLAGIFFVVYLLHRKTLLQFKYSNGCIALDTEYLPVAEEKKLLGRMRALIEAQEEAARQFAQAQQQRARTYVPVYTQSEPRKPYPYQ